MDKDEIDDIELRGLGQACQYFQDACNELRKLVATRDPGEPIPADVFTGFEILQGVKKYLDKEFCRLVTGN